MKLKPRELPKRLTPVPPLTDVVAEVRRVRLGARSSALIFGSSQVHPSVHLGAIVGLLRDHLAAVEDPDRLIGELLARYAADPYGRHLARELVAAALQGRPPLVIGAVRQARALGVGILATLPDTSGRTT